MNDPVLYTTQGAIALVKRAERLKGTKFAVRLLYDAPIEGEPGRVFPAGLHSYIVVSKADALRIVAGLVSPGLEARGARIPITQSDFTPSYAGASTSTTYWIG